MAQRDQEDELLLSVAMQNASSIVLARQRAEQDLLRAKEALELQTQALANSLAMMRATLEATTDGIVVTGENDRVTGYNENFVRMWRIPREVIEDGDRHRLVEFISGQFGEAGRFLARTEEIRASAPQETYDVLETADGRVFERYSKIQIVHDRSAGRVWSFRDITARRRAEEELQRMFEERQQLLERERTARAEAERLSGLKDDFLATLSHELRTPLSAILGWSQVLRRRMPDGDADLRHGLEAIERNVRAQTQLIEDLLDMSRITSGKLRLDMHDVDPASVVEAALETVKPAADAKGIGLEKVLDSAACPVSGDPGRLQQVIWNLLSNAIKFTPKGGRVRVLLERADPYVAISVADTGTGIRPEFLPYVFERFRQADPSTTRAYGGLGLGLSIVKHLVELHGGTVQARSPGDEGRGTVFAVRLPLAAPGARADMERPQPRTARSDPVDFERADLSGIKVLVIDDDEDACDLVKRVLGECRASVLCAGTADEAISLVAAERPHVLVTDIGMPDVDGYEFLRRVRALGSARGGETPAIALTAFARSDDKARALDAGFAVHVSKPVEPSELVATIASVARRGEEPGGD